MRGLETLERGEDLPEPWLIDLIRNPDPNIIERLGMIASDAERLPIQRINSAN